MALGGAHEIKPKKKRASACSKINASVGADRTNAGDQTKHLGDKRGRDSL